MNIYYIILLYRESNIIVPSAITEVPEIKFDKIIEEIKECDITSNQIRIEKYELKGFNSMTPIIKKDKANQENKPIKISSLFTTDLVDNNYLDWGIDIKDFNEINDLKNGRMKYEKCTFDKVTTDKISLGKYGNANIINCIIFLNIKKKKYFEELFTRFEIDKGLFEVKLIKRGRTKKYLFDNKIIKKTPFIHCPEANFWIYFIEKGIAKITKHYINTIPLMASDIFSFLCPSNSIVYTHHNIKRKELYDILKDIIKKNQSYIIYSEKDSMSSEVYIKLNYISYFITNIFKVNGNKYIEMFIPIIPEKCKIISDISEEDSKNERYFSKVKIESGHFFFFKFEWFYKEYKQTIILKYNPNYFFNFQRIVLIDRNVNLIKIKVDKTTKCAISFNLPHPFLFRFVLAKLSIIENYIRRIKTMSSQEGNNEESNSYYTDEIDYNFEYLDSLYQYDTKGTIEVDLPEGIYSVLFNVYTNNEIKVTVNCYSDNAVEFLDNAEKISEQKLNSQIKTLFLSYIKKSDDVKKFQVEDNNQIIAYESLINQKFGYSIYMVENLSDNQNVYLDLFTEVDGMNLITKDYSPDSTNINIIIPPKNAEIIVFEWEKTFNEIEVFLNPLFNLETIEPMFNEEAFLNLKRNYIAKTKVYYIEIQYRSGVFLVFVNEGDNEDFLIQLIFETFSNLEFKGLKREELEEKKIEIDLPARSYMSYNLKSLDIEIDFSYKISLKIAKNKHKANNG